LKSQANDIKSLTGLSGGAVVRFLCTPIVRD